MSLKTLSKFYYGHQVTQKNRYISFSEGGPEITAELRPGSYTLSKYAIEVARAMTEVGGQDYLPILDRATRKITISAENNFELLCFTGTTSGATALTMIGFNMTEDKSGSNSYESDNGSGMVFSPQLLLQDYVPFENKQGFTGTTVNKSAYSTEIISIGRQRFMKCNVKYQTNKPIGNNTGRYEQDDEGLENLRSFMLAVTEAQKIEFMPDRDNVDNYYNCIIESTAGSKNGTEFEIQETFNEKLPDFYHSGLMTFREIK